MCPLLRVPLHTATSIITHHYMHIYPPLSISVPIAMRSFTHRYMYHCTPLTYRYLPLDTPLHTATHPFEHLYTYMYTPYQTLAYPYTSPHLPLHIINTLKPRKYIFTHHYTHYYTHYKITFALLRTLPIRTLLESLLMTLHTLHSVLSLPPLLFLTVRGVTLHAEPS